MIIDLIFYIIGGLLGAIFYFLPIVDIASLPYFGTEIQTTLIWWMHTWNAFLVTFPYAETGWQIFKWIIIPFEIALLVGKVLLGSRVPKHD